jgi:hypothetical protein
MQGNDSLPEYKTIEFGLDVTPLLSYVTPGEEYKFFLIVDEEDPKNLANGQVRHFSLMDYSDGLTQIACDEQNVSLVENGRTLLSIIHSPLFDPLTVKTQSLPLYTPGQTAEVHLEAEGGQEPYTWQLDKNYLMSENTTAFPAFNGELIIESSFEDSLAIQQLDFSFPFYGNSFDSVAVSSSGYVYFDENMYFWSYIRDLSYYFKNVRVIAPFMCQGMIVNNYYDHGVWYEGDETKASFRWTTTFSHMPELSTCNFALTLYPNGNIDFYYGDIVAYEELNWVAGISDGDLCNYSLPDLPMPSMISSGTRVEFIAGEFPSSVTLSEDGHLSFLESSEAVNADVKVIVTDNTLLKAHKTFQLTDGLELLLTLDGSDDNSISNGQTAGINLFVRNRGSAGIQNIEFELNCDHPLVNILESQHSIESLEAGESVALESVFSLNCNASMGDKQQIVLHLDAQSSARNYKRDFYLKSTAPSVKMLEYELMSDIGILEPGKTTELKFRILNEGSRQANKVLAILRAEVPGISINNNQPLNLGPVAPGGYATASYNITADYSIQYGTKVHLNLKLVCEGGPANESKIPLWYGKTPVCIVDMDLDTSSGPQIGKLLQEMEISTEYTRSFPNSLLKFQSVILCLGKNFINHDITSSQSQILTEYLDQGGSLYMEGRAAWEQNPYYPIFEMFNIETFTTPALYEVLDGVDGSFTEGLSYENTALQPFNYYYLVPQAPAFSIFTGRDYPYCAAVAYDAGSYKTIGTIFELGALISSDSCELETYMQEVLDFFGVVESTLGIEEIPSGNYAGASQNYPNPFSQQTKIPLVLESKSRVEAAIYDMQGRRIYELQTPAVLESGQYVFTWNAIGKDGNPVPGGIYIYRLIIDGIPSSGKMILIR